jgi:cytochrome bd-type quinol oxidase subunit 2
VLGRAFAPGPVSEEELGPLDNPLGLDAIAGPAPALLSLITVLLLAVMLAAVAAVLVRLRRARGVERQQLKWFAYAASLLGVAVVVAVVLPSAASSLVDTVTIMLALAALPVAVGIALLRYRLYEIDRLINRTLVYGLLTALLIGVYAGLVFLLGDLLNPADGSSELAVAASTLAVAALFQPARRRVQAVVDRRFNRRRYDAARTVEAFSARLRDQVDLDTLSAELLGVVDDTVQPTQASLWLR